MTHSTIFSPCAALNRPNDGGCVYPARLAVGRVLSFFDSLIRHAAKFCLREPRNATQLSCGASRA